MLFNSFEFLFFIAIFFLLWPLMRTRIYLRWLYLTVASCIFYGWTDWRFIILLGFVSVSSYWAARAIEAFPGWRKTSLGIGIAANLLVLCCYKYLGFLLGNVQSLFSVCGVQWTWPAVTWGLPIGLSFYTFMAISYLVDVYVRTCKPTRSLLHYTAYLALFPHLVAGPIVRAADLLPQLLTREGTSTEDKRAGLILIVQGYFKKVVIADNLAPAVNQSFGPDLGGTGYYWWIVVTMFAFQIYYDFGGYTDIARGLARWMGYRFPLNFHNPYHSASLREFWSRWHISLSTWFRDYVYIPLGGSRVSNAREHFNLWVTMLLCGLWHGPAWNFVLWGAVHAAFLSVERLTQWPQRLSRTGWGRLSCHALLLLQVWVGWVFFRAPDLNQAGQVLYHLFHPRFFFRLGAAELSMVYRPAFLGLTLALVWELMNSQRVKDLAAGITEGSRAKLEPVYLATLIFAAVYLRGPGSAFIYFQF